MFCFKLSPIVFWIYVICANCPTGKPIPMKIDLPFMKMCEYNFENLRFWQNSPTYPSGHLHILSVIQVPPFAHGIAHIPVDVKKGMVNLFVEVLPFMVRQRYSLVISF